MAMVQGIGPSMMNEIMTAAGVVQHRGPDGRRPFETHELLNAVDAIDRLRDFLNDAENGGPPQLRTDILRLHERAMNVVNYQCDDNVREKFFDDATDIADQVAEMAECIGQLEVTLNRLADLSPI